MTLTYYCSLTAAASLTCVSESSSLRLPVYRVLPSYNGLSAVGKDNQIWRPQRVDPSLHQQSRKAGIRAVSERSSLDVSPLNQKRLGTGRVSNDSVAKALEVVASARRGSGLSDRYNSLQVSKQVSLALSRCHESRGLQLGGLSKGKGSAKWKRRSGRVQAERSGALLEAKSSKAVKLQEQSLYLALDPEGHRWTAPLDLKDPVSLVQYMKQVPPEAREVETISPAKMDGLIGSVAGMNLEQLLTDDAVFTRELSWLCMNWRVLRIAMDQKTPAHERLRFLGVAAASLDEFFECRVASLKWKEAITQESGTTHGTTRGRRSPQEQLKKVSLAVRDILSAQTATLEGSILPELRKHGVSIKTRSELTTSQQASLRAHFKLELEPLLTPLAVDPGHPFPFIKHLSLNIAVLLRDPIDDSHQFAIVTVPSNIPRWKALPQEPGSPAKQGVIPLEEIVVSNLDRLFGGMEILSAHPFRATRTMLVLDDLRKGEEDQADEPTDLAAIIAQEMHERKFSPFVRLEVYDSMPQGLVARLAGEMDLDLEQDVYTVNTPLALCDLQTLPPPPDSPAPLHFPPWQPVTHPRFADVSGSPSALFDEIRCGGDVLVKHPYHSFATSTQAFFEAAARDPAVVAVKAILYKTSANSPVVEALVAAAEAGKQVTVLVELKARCEEARNINIAEMLEDAGCNVAYGLVGLTTHAKASMVVRKEGSEHNTYVHMGTGDYNARQAATYTDFSLFSCDPELGRDVSDFFKYLTGFHRQKGYHKLLVAPHSMHRQLIRLCDTEIENARKGRPAGITIKCNALDDQVLCSRLYAASAAGVKVNLIVRGACRVRPGVPGISDNIRVVSIMGRFLEHSRVMKFENGGDPRFYLSSANCTTRDLTRRVELALRVDDRKCKQELQAVLDVCLTDRSTAWEMRPDGLYSLPHPRDPAGAPETGAKTARLAAIGLQAALMEEALKEKERVQKSDKLKVKAALRPSHGSAKARGVLH